ncbi:NADP-dependent isocitrate dehydrogenase [Corynebacterium coyleae]
MNSFEVLVQAMSAAALETLADFDLEVALASGFAPDRARAWARLRDVYFGRTKFTRKQKTASSLARGFSLDELVLIERRIASVKDASQRWALRLALLDAELAEVFGPIAKDLRDNAEAIDSELLNAQGNAADLGGYYWPDDAKTSAVMRPSATFNKIIDALEK